MHPNHKTIFQYLNYHTEFSCEGDNRLEMDVYSCFNEIVRKHRQPETRCLKVNELCSNTYHIVVYFSSSLIDTDENNCCFLSKDELGIWIEDMKKFAQFEWSFSDDTKNVNQDKDGSVIVNIEFKNRPFVEHFVVLEMIKHSYEFPFSYSVYQAVKFRNVINPDELLVNLSNMIFCCNKEFRNNACGDHVVCISVYFHLSDYNTFDYVQIVKLPTAEEIKKAIPLADRMSLLFNPKRDCDPFIDYCRFNTCKKDGSYFNSEELDEKYKNILNITKKFEYYSNITHNCDIRNFNSYFNVEGMKERLDCYIKTYDNLKQNED